MPKLPKRTFPEKPFLYQRDPLTGRALRTDETVAREEGIERLRSLTAKLAQTSQRVLGEAGHLIATVECDGVAVGKTPEKNEFVVAGEGDNHALPIYLESPYVKRIDTDEVVHADKGASEITHDGMYGHQLEIVTRDHKPSGKRITPVEFAKILEIVPQQMAYRAKADDTYQLDRIDYQSVPFKSLLDQANACQFNVNLEGESGHNFFDDGKGYESPLHILFVQEMLKFQIEGGLLIFTPNESGYARLKRHGPTEPDAHFVGKRKGLGNFPTFFLRGPHRDVAREDDPREHKHVDKGGVRTEIRSGSPECITMTPSRSPYLVVETLLQVMIRTLERYKDMSPAERATLTPESLWELPRVPFPENFRQLKDKFRKSDYISEHYGDLRTYALSVLDRERSVVTAGAR